MNQQCKHWVTWLSPWFSREEIFSFNFQRYGCQFRQLAPSKPSLQASGRKARVQSFRSANLKTAKFITHRASLFFFFFFSSMSSKKIMVLLNPLISSLPCRGILPKGPTGKPQRKTNWLKKLVLTGCMVGTTPRLGNIFGNKGRISFPSVRFKLMLQDPLLCSTWVVFTWVKSFLAVKTLINPSFY